MKKIILFIFCFLSFNVFVNASELNIDSKNALLINLKDNTILFEKNRDEKIRIASMTKIMTTIVSIENIQQINDSVVLTQEVFEGLKEADASIAGFFVGQIVTYKDLLYGSMIPSGADATRALAINIAGSEEKFVEMMNEKAKIIGMKNTNFVNTSGLDQDNQYSTVTDVATLLKYALKNELFKELFTTREYMTSDKKIEMTSTLNYYSKKFNVDTSIIKGAKTGYTKKAEMCLASISSYNGVDLLLVTAGAKVMETVPTHIMDANNIYNYFFKNYSYKTVITKDEEILKLPTDNGSPKQISFKSQQDIIKYVPNDFDKKQLILTYDGINTINKSNKKGNNIGNLTIEYDEILLDSIPIILNQNTKFGIMKFINIYTIIASLIIIFTGFIYSKKLKIRNS